MSEKRIVLTMGESNRKCGECQLCCRLLPLPLDDYKKRAGSRCAYQRFGKGCVIHAAKPEACRLWSCWWLADPELTAGLPRPDRAHYVLDMVPDYVTIIRDGERTNVLVLQVWVDPDFPDAHRAPSLRAYLAKLAEKDGVPALIRYDETRGFLLTAPSMSANRQWTEHRSNLSIVEERDTTDLLDELSR